MSFAPVEDRNAPLLPEDDPAANMLPDEGRPLTGHGIPSAMELFWLLGKYAAHIEGLNEYLRTCAAGARHFAEPDWSVEGNVALEDREAAWVRRAHREYLEFPLTHLGRL